MKTLLIFLISLALCAGLFAAHQYEAIHQNQGVGVHVNQSVELFLNTSSSKLPEGITEFGYYKLDSKGDMIQGSSTSLDMSALLKNGSVSLGSFSGGDSIAFWMKTDKGSYLDSYYRDGKHGDRNAAYLGNNSKNNTNMVMGNLDLSHGWSPSQGFQDNALVFEVSNVGKGPSGQPLPGFLATLAIGGGVIGGLSILRRKNMRKKA